MKIYSLSASDEASIVTLVNDDADGWERLCYPNPSNNGEPWQSPQAQLHRVDDEGIRRRDVDFPSHGYDCLIMSGQAKRGLENFLAPHGEFLRLACDDAELYVFNVSTQYDALDTARSSPLHDYDEDCEPVGEPVGITTPYAFKTQAIGDAPLFRVPELKTFFITECFLDKVKQLGLTGLEVRLEFDSQLHSHGFDHLGRPRAAPEPS